MCEKWILKALKLVQANYIGVSDNYKDALGDRDRYADACHNTV